MCGKIPIFHKGKLINYSIVDDEDFNIQSKFRWHPTKGGYIYRTIRLDKNTTKSIYLHREILGVSYVDHRVKQVDHINHNKLDNQKINLRIITDAQNKQNRPSVKGSNSKYRGVSFHKKIKKWQAYGSVNGKSKYLGYFDDEKEAAKVASNWRKENMPYTIEVNNYIKEGD